MVLFLNAFSGVLSTMVFPGLERQFRVLTVAGDVTMILLGLSALWRNRSFYGASSLIAFMVCSLVSVIANADRISPLSQLNGLRQPLFYLSALVVTFEIFQSKYRELLVRLMSAFLIVFAVLQIPISLIQFREWGAGDGVGGSFGIKGGSGDLTQLLFLIVFYLLVRYGGTSDARTFKISRLVLFSMLLIPITVNETKIAFIYLVVFVALVALSRKNLVRSMVLVAVGFVLFGTLVWYYTQNVGDPSEVFNERFLEGYLYSDSRRGIDIPRFQKLVLASKVHGADLLSHLFGVGYGFQAGEGFLETSKMARQLWYFRGSKNLLTMTYLQGGFAAVMILGFATMSFLRSSIGTTGVEKRFGVFLLLILLSMWLYNEALLNRTFGVLVSFFMVWLNHQTLSENTASPRFEDLSEG
jgi:hypothetical protein